MSIDRETDFELWFGSENLREFDNHAIMSRFLSELGWLWNGDCYKAKGKSLEELDRDLATVLNFYKYKWAGKDVRIRTRKIDTHSIGDYPQSREKPDEHPF